MDAQFLACLKVVLDFEGGYSDRPNDRGGPTKWGVTQTTYAYYRSHVMKQPVRPVSMMERSECEDLYLRYFYNPASCSLMDPKWSLAVFDTTVLCSKDWAIDWLQEALGVTVDGKFGPITYAAMKKAGEGEMVLFLGLREAFHRRRVTEDPTQEQFLEGWLNRLEKLRTILRTFAVVAPSASEVKPSPGSNSKSQPSSRG